jgi:probable phosphoglycerate mutase
VKKCLINHFSGADLDLLWDPPFIHGTSLTVMEIDRDRRELTMIGDMSHAEHAKQINNVQ